MNWIKEKTEKYGWILALIGIPPDIIWFRDILLKKMPNSLMLGISGAICVILVAMFVFWLWFKIENKLKTKRKITSQRKFNDAFTTDPRLGKYFLDYLPQIGDIFDDEIIYGLPSPKEIHIKRAIRLKTETKGAEEVATGIPVKYIDDIFTKIQSWRLSGNNIRKGMRHFLNAYLSAFIGEKYAQLAEKLLNESNEKENNDKLIDDMKTDLEKTDFSRRMWETSKKLWGGVDITK